jgi:2-(1,2-epoxy-1,2-dihydrophenyl)acetyl-CoA isomerase
MGMTAEADEPPVLHSRHGGVLTLVLNRPARKNALNADAWELLFQHLNAASIDDDVRCVVLTGADHTFCAGADISAVPTGHPLVRIRHLGRVAELLHHFPKPVVAVVEGYAVGAGWNLALCCDVVVASTTAQFSQIFVGRGLSPDFGGSWLLPRLVGLQQAKRLAFLAERITAREATDLGLVTWMVEADELEATVRDLTTRLATMPPIALSQTKELLNAGATSTFREALESEARAQTINYATEDAPRAIRAFTTKEDVTYTGKWRLEE